MYLKWLLNTQTRERVSEEEALEAFGTEPLSREEMDDVCFHRKWMFIQVAGISTLLVGVTLIQAQAQWKKVLTSKKFT